MTPTLRDALAIKRISTMRKRRIRALAMIRLQATPTDDTCDCGLCVIRRAGNPGFSALLRALNDPMPDDLGDISLGDGKAGVH